MGKTGAGCVLVVSTLCGNAVISDACVFPKWNCLFGDCREGFSVDCGFDICSLYSLSDYDFCCEVRATD